MPKDVAVKSTANSTAISLPPEVEALKRELAKAADSAELGGSAAAIVADMQQKILTAESIDDIFEVANKGTASVTDWVDKPIEIIGFRVLNSGEQYKGDGALDAYLLISFVDLMTGEEVVLTAGGVILTTMLVSLYRKGALPVQCAFTVTTTGANNEVHKLRRLTDVERRALAKPSF